MKNHAFRLRHAALPLALAAAFPVLGQSRPAPTLKETVVTATRVQQPLSDIVADVTILDRERIERSGATGLVDVLARQPGVEFSRNGGQGSTTGLFVRGAESRVTAVYIDGVRVDSQATGGAAWESIPISQIDRIEILRGPAAAVYGSDAIAGVIQIFTRRGEGAFTPHVGVGIGSQATRTAEAGFSGRQGALDYSLGIAAERSKGFNSRISAGQNRDLDGYENRSVSASLGLQASSAHRFEATLLDSELESQYDGTPATRDDRNFHELRTLGLAWKAQWTDAYSTRLSFGDSRESYETKPSPYLTVTELRNYTFFNEYRAGNHLFTAALERREDHLRNAPIDRGREQDAVALGYGFTDKVHTVQLNVRHDRDSEFGGKTTGSAAYAFQFLPSWRASASAGTAFRVPTLYQRFSEYGQASLVPETSKNVEVGVRWTQGASSAGLVVYRNNIDNLITFGPPGPCPGVFGCYYNTAKARYAGATLSGEHKWGDANLRASLDVQNPRDLTADKQLPRRARKHGTFGVDLPVAGWNFGVETQFSGERYDTVANTTKLGGYTLVNLFAQRRFAKDWTVLARIDNVADKDYELARTYATQGRYAYVGVKWAPQ
ncbi:MAG: TonB-dependent receptor [Burkholderiaceae bacterium]